MSHLLLSMLRGHTTVKMAVKKPATFMKKGQREP